MTWLQRSLDIAARFLALHKMDFWRPTWPATSLPSAGACYRALRRLPGQVLHLLEERVFQDAPCTPLYGESQELSGRGRWPQSTMVLDQYRYTPPSSRSATLIALRGATGMRTS